MVPTLVDPKYLMVGQTLSTGHDSNARTCRVQDVYTAGQPGIQRCLQQIEDLVSRVDSVLTAHFTAEGINFFQFAFRWVNCMLIRELPFDVAVRLWDTYLAEGMHFSEFLPYACAAFLLFWTKQLKAMDFQDMILFLQKTPTGDWTYKEIEAVLSHAYMLRIQAPHVARI
jgi:TBC1 domain family member 2